MRISVCGVLALSLLLAAGCHKKQPVTVVTPTTPAPPSVPEPPGPAPSAVTLDAALREFASGDYVSADRDFRRYLEMIPAGGSRDNALFYLGYIYASPSQQNWIQARTFLTQLISEFPQSSLRPIAELILSIQDQSVQLSAEVSRANSQAAQLQREIAQLKNDSAQSSEKVTRLNSEVEQLRQKAQESEQIIRQLNADLDRLIKIDQNRNRPQF